MGKKSSSKKQMSLAAAVKEAEEGTKVLNMDEDVNGTSQKSSKRSKSKGEKKKKDDEPVEKEEPVDGEEEELKFDYTAGENGQEESEKPAGRTRSIFIIEVVTRPSIYWVS